MRGEAEIGILHAPHNRPEGIQRVGKQALLLFLGGEGMPIAFKESFRQVGPVDPILVGIAGEVGGAHVPAGKLEIDQARPGTGAADQPVGRAVIPVTGRRAFTFEGLEQI